MNSQFKLFTTNRFLPFFVTQFFGAFNDNVFKNALIVLIVFQLATSSNESLLVNLSAGLFILPFFLFSSLAGQLAEKYEKSKLMVTCKAAELAIMGLATVGLFAGNIYILMTVLFLMGTQSTFFGPVKYSILPQHLKDNELLGGNGLVEMGTFLAILIGTMVGSYYIVQDGGKNIISSILILFSVVGYIASRFVPKAESSFPNEKIDYNPITSSISLFKVLKERRKSVSLSVIGISWFWFLGAVYLTQLPSFVKNNFHGDETIVTLFLVAFSVGIAIGSLICEKLSRNIIELGIVPLGSIGITLFGILLYFNGTLNTDIIGEMITSSDFFLYPTLQVAAFSLFMIGVFGGLYTVPLYALIQKRTEPEYRSRVIAANNMLNALFMVISAIASILLLSSGLQIHELFLVLSLFSAVVSIYIYKKVPEFFIRFVIWILSHTIYRVQHNNINNLPEEGGCVVVANHISFFDALLLAGSFKRPLRFVMYEPIYRLPVLNSFFKAVGAIPIDSKKANPKVYEESFVTIKELLENGEVLCLFPEGGLTPDGEIAEFKRGIEKIISETPVPVLPTAIQGLWGSMFSRKNKVRFPRLTWSKLNVNVGELLQPEEITAAKLEKEVKKLRGDKK